MTVRRTLIKGARAVTMDPTLGEIASADLLIEGDRIADIAPSIDVAEDMQVVDAAGMIMMPGLINGHMHTWQTALRGTAGDLTLRAYFTRVHEGIGRRITPQDTHVAILAGALHQLHCGVTTLVDWHHANHSVEHTDAAVDALLASGIRAVYGHGISRPKGDTPDLAHPRDRIERLRHGRLASDETLVTLAMCILGPGLSPLDIVRRDVELARELNLTWSLHTGAQGIPAITPDAIHSMAAAGLLGPDGNFVHACEYSDEDLQLLVDHGSTVTVAPEVEMQFGHGVPVTGRLLKLGGMPAIGADLEAMHVGDMFVQMRAALQSQRGFENLTREKPIAALNSTARDALTWATLGNARSMRLDHRIGSLTPGKQADIVLLRATDINLVPVNDAIQSIVFHASAQNVDTVFVAGNVRKRNGVLTYPAADLRRLLGELEVSAKRLLLPAD